VCGRGIGEGKVEVKWRHESDSREISLEAAAAEIVEMLAKERGRLA
jgi:hypothetical protein